MILRNALPFTCIISGLCLAFNLDLSLSFYTGILLMLIACLIWLKRLEERQIKIREIREHG